MYRTPNIPHNFPDFQDDGHLNKGRHVQKAPKKGGGDFEKLDEEKDWPERQGS